MNWGFFRTRNLIFIGLATIAIHMAAQPLYAKIAGMGSDSQG
jgi:hypothetical protein